jgi:hypothetical protein
MPVGVISALNRAQKIPEKQLLEEVTIPLLGGGKVDIYECPAGFKAIVEGRLRSNTFGNGDMFVYFKNLTAFRIRVTGGGIDENDPLSIAANANVPFRVELVAGEKIDADSQSNTTNGTIIFNATILELPV